MLKQIILSIVLFSCLAGAAFYQEENSVLRTRDELSQNARAFFVALSKGDRRFFDSFFADDVEVKINSVTINGKQEYIERLNRIANVIFEDMTFDDLHVHTNYFSPDAIRTNGKTFGEFRPEATIWTNAWAINHAVGRTTKKKVSVPLHLDFRWVGGKVVQMLGYYDPKNMNEEIAALEASKQ